MRTQSVLLIIFISFIVLMICFHKPLRNLANRWSVELAKKAPNGIVSSSGDSIINLVERYCGGVSEICQDRDFNGDKNPDVYIKTNSGVIYALKGVYQQDGTTIYDWIKIGK